MSLFQTKTWVVAPPAPPDLIAAVPEHPLLVQILFNRGLRTASEMSAFLNHTDAIKENPYRLRDMAEAVTRLVRAIEKGEVICVYGDFDADGVSATALLVTALQAAGGRVGPYIPDRVDEGYGLNVDAIERVASQAQLMVTVDCGIRSVAEVQLANQLGLDVIITDHHSVGPTLPPALAVINPRRKDCPSKFERLAGVGVAYRLAQAVLRAVAQHTWARISPEQATEIEESLLDLVALGTVADMMPLLGDNRTLVVRGLAQINRVQRPGFEAMLQQADLRPGAVDAAAIAFRLAPRINAAGRLAHAKLAYQLLRTKDPGQAFNLTRELEALNQERQRLTSEAQAAAELQLASAGAEPPPLISVSSPDFKPGIVGLVAGKLTERFYRPAVVIEQGAQESRGSARSIAEVDISAALDEVSHLLLRHGGHRRAAGFTVETVRMPAFLQELGNVVERALTPYDELRPSLEIDAEVDFGMLNWGLQEQFKRLEPTGYENHAPLLLTRNVRVREVRTVGEGKHLRLIVDDGNDSAVLDAVGFHQGERHPQIQVGSQLDLVYQLEANEWQGRRRLQLNIQDLRSSCSTC